MSRRLTRFTSRSMASVRFVAQRGLLKPLVWSLVRVRVHGAEHARRHDGPFIAIANHSSHLDAPLIMGALPRRQARYLAAGAAADYFFDITWRKWLTTLFFNAFPIERNAERRRTGISRDLLALGVPVLIFPEGGRSATGDIGRFKPGPAALASAMDVPVLPIALVGACDAMPRGTSWPKRGRMPVDVVIGEPMIARPGEPSERFAARLSDRVRAMHAARGGTVQQRDAPEPAQGGTR